jgi:hypothetical protein
MGKIKLLSTEDYRHPGFGTSSIAKNRNTKIYELGDLTIKFGKEEWWDPYDTDAEFCIQIGPVRFYMFPDDMADHVESRLSMEKDNDLIACLITKIKEGNTEIGEKEKAISAVVEDGSAREMNNEWIALAHASKLSVEEFTDCLIDEFGIFWFGGFHFLPKLASKTKRGG